MSAKERIANFAAANGWRYNVECTLPDEATYAPSIANLGKNPSLTESFAGTWAGHPFESYLFSCTLPGRETEKRYSVRVFRLDFDNSVVMPHIFVTCNTSNRRSMLSVVPRRFDQSQKLSLEAAFGDTFTAYSHVGTKTDAVSFLPPNTLMTMIENNQRFDVEIVGHSLYLYSDDTWAAEDMVKEAFCLMDGISKHIAHRLQSWRFVLPNDTYPYLQSTPGYGDLVVRRRRFDARVTIGAIVYIFAFSRIWAADDIASTITAKLLFTLAITVVVVVGVLIPWRRA